MLRLLIILLIFPSIAMCEDSDMPDSIKDVKARHEERLLQLPGVASVGIGLDENGNQAIIVGLTSRDPNTESKIPPRLEGYPVLIQIVGNIKAQ